MKDIESKDGGVIELEVIRANGDVEYIGKIHNIIGSVAWQSVATAAPGRIPYTSIADSQSGTPYFNTQTARGSVYLSGLYSQAGNTVTRTEGTSSLSDLSNGDIIEFETGEWAYKTATINPASCTVSKSQSVAATTAKYHKTNTAGYGNFPATNSVQQLSTGSYTMLGEYSNGVVTNTMQAPRLFAPATVAYTLRCISVMVKTGTSFDAYSTYYDLPNDINIGIGDMLQISSFVFRVTWDAYTPRAFAVSPLTGVVGSGRTQRLMPVFANEYVDFIKLYLISDANKLVLPNMSAASVNISSIPNRIETIVATPGTKVPASWTNNAVESISTTGTVAVGGDVKQIFWGDNNFVYGVVEYDTPVNLTPGKVINIQTSAQMIVARPDYGTNPYVPIPPPPLDSWQSDSVDYFLTSAWTTSTLDNSTGNVTGWNSAKGVMATTRTVADAVRTGSGVGRRCIRPQGNLRMTGHPTGEVGIVFVFRRTDTNFCRLINYGSYGQGWYILSPGTNIALDGLGAGSAGSSAALVAENAAPYAWHSVAIKYNTTSSYIPKLWVDGTELVTGKSLSANIHPIMLRFGDSGSYDYWELGDFAVYSNPSDANMAIYSTQLATKWQAP